MAATGVHSFPSCSNNRPILKRQLHEDSNSNRLWTQFDPSDKNAPALSSVPWVNYCRPPNIHRQFYTCSTSLHDTSKHQSGFPPLVEHQLLRELCPCPWHPYVHAGSIH